MNNPIDWLRSKSDRNGRSVASSQTTPVPPRNPDRVTAIATLRDEISRLQRELVVLSQPDEELSSPKSRSQNQESMNVTERRLREAQRELATYQARI